MNADDAGSNKAGVVIDNGKEVKTVCIYFKGDSITGAQALELANADPIFQSFAGQGRAVCSLCGVGCPGDSTCLTCMGAKFWNYFNSPKGTNSFSLSGVGAGSSIVRNGDVQGWKFGVGQKPPYVGFNTICGIEIPEETKNTNSGNTNNENTLENKTINSKTDMKQNTKVQAQDNTEQVVTSVPVSVLGTQVTRSNTASKVQVKKLNEANKNETPRGLILLGSGAIAFSYFIYKTKTSNKTKLD